MSHVIVAWDRQGSEKEWKNFKKAMSLTLSSIESDDFKCIPDEIEYISTKDWVDRLVKEDNDLKLLLISESFDGRVLGTGSIKSWRKQRPDLRIILVVADDRRGLAKLNGLYELGFYDVLYNRDFNGENLARLLIKKRSKERAFKYYGLEMFHAPVKEASKEEITDKPDIKTAEKVIADSDAADKGKKAAGKKDAAKDKEKPEKDEGQKTTKASNKAADSKPEATSSDKEDVKNDAQKSEDEKKSSKITKKSADSDNEEQAGTVTIKSSAKSTSKKAKETASSKKDTKKDKKATDTKKADRKKDGSEKTKNKKKVEPSPAVEDEVVAEYEPYDETVENPDVPEYEPDDEIPAEEIEGAEDAVSEEAPVDAPDEIYEDGYAETDSEETDTVVEEPGEFVSYDDFSAFDDDEEYYEDEDFSDMGPQGEEENLSSMEYLVPAGAHETVVDDISSIIAQGEDAMYDFYHKCEAEALTVENMYPEMNIVDQLQEQLLYFFTRRDTTWLKNYEQKLISKEAFDQNLWQLIRQFGSEMGVTDEEAREAFEKFSLFLYGYDIIEPFIHDPDVSDVKILRPDLINIKLKGKRYRSKVVFRSDDHYRGFVNRIQQRNHVLLNDNEPKKTFMDTTTCEDVRLRFVVSTEYVESTNLPAVVIRKESNVKKSFDDLIQAGMMDIEVCVKLIDMARHGWSVIFSGEMASGKTTLYNTLLDFYSHGKSMQTMQENEELFNNSHPNNMFERIQKSPDGKINFDLKYLAFFSLLEDVDIVGIGEIKGGEAKYFIDCIYANIIALASIHSPSAKDALPRLADLAKYDSDYSVRDLLRRISTMKGVVVQLEKYKVREIAKIAGWDDEKGEILYEDIYIRDKRKDEKNAG